MNWTRATTGLCNPVWASLAVSKTGVALYRTDTQGSLSGHICVLGIAVTYGEGIRSCRGRSHCLQGSG